MKFDYNKAGYEQKISDTEIKYTDSDGATMICTVTPVTRKEGISILIKKGIRFNDFSLVRNYELETALDSIGMYAYRITGLCPINNFSFFLIDN